MSITNLFRRLMVPNAKPRTIRRRPSPLGRFMEGLEERAVPAVLTVDDNGPAMYATIQAALDASADGDTISVAAGTYNESLAISTDVTLAGAGSGSTFVTAPGTGYLVSLRASGVSISGFTFDGGVTAAFNGNTTAATGASAGIINNFAPGITIPVSDTSITDNVIRNLGGDGIVLQQAGAGNTITGNVISNFGYNTAFAEGYAGIGLFNNTIATVTGNTITMPNGLGSPPKQFGIQIDGVGLPDAKSISGNTIVVSKDSIGISINLVYGGGTLTVDGNYVYTSDPMNADTSGFEPSRGINVQGLYGSSVALTGNYVNASGFTSPTSSAYPAGVGYTTGSFGRGISLYNVGTGVTISGGAVGNSAVGLDVQGSDPIYGGSTTNTTVSVTSATIGGIVGVRLNNSPPANTTFLPGADAAERAAAAAPKSNLQVNFLNGSILGGVSGTNAAAISLLDAADGFTTKVSLGGTGAGTAVTGMVRSNAPVGSTETAVEDLRRTRKFDFGPSSQTVAAGFIGLDAATARYATLGDYGFTAAVNSYSVSTGAALTRDGITGTASTPATFQVDLVANKTYSITVYTGIPATKSQTQVTATASGATVTPTTPASSPVPAGATYSANNGGVFKTVTYTVTTTSATTLNLAFSLFAGTLAQGNNGSTNWAVNGVDVLQIN